MMKVEPRSAALAGTAVYAAYRPHGTLAAGAVVVAVLVVAQKLLPATTAIDLPLALAIGWLGVVIVIMPSLVPGLSPPM
jgi:hypothetical protein